jgi:type II secretory pathway pseudopilin PulG
LLLVLALLAIVMSFAAPSLSAFFRGRTIESEARRLLSLTRYGQSRAVYKELKLEVVSTNPPPAGLKLEVLQPATSEMAEFEKRGLPGIRFMPDGSIAETSPPEVRLTDRDGKAQVLALSGSRLTYEIRAEKE